MSYGRCWRACWSLLTTVGFGLTMLEMSPGSAALGVLLLAPSAGMVIVLVRGRLHRQHPGRDPVRPRDAAMQALGWGTTLLVAATVIGGSPPVALLLGLVAVTTCPPVVERWRPGRAGVRAHPGGAASGEPDPTPGNAPPPSADVVRIAGGLSYDELCDVWRSTFWELHEQHTDVECLTLVMLRQACLDELGRRNPDALNAWLASGARASSSPDRFLHPPDHGSHDVA